MIVGWTDLALLWYPPHFGTAEWEFGTISRHLDGMPLGTVGLGMLIAGAIGLKQRVTVRILSVVCGLVAVVLLAACVLYLLGVPPALGGVAPAVKPALEKAIVKAGVYSVTYTVLYVWLTWFLWRKTRRGT